MSPIVVKPTTSSVSILEMSMQSTYDNKHNNNNNNNN